MEKLQDKLQHMAASDDPDMRKCGRQLAQRIKAMVQGDEILKERYKDIVTGTIFADEAEKERQRKKEKKKDKTASASQDVADQ